ncbi:hypothetical protein NQ317_012494 [Molorchus minor]|uniref:Uncharacterized protein n=1 Tax=Molorchus minor TaxID=1323400 RepID=A0ABQ9K2X8_9CUCU|nr:hypothetical protein NQ317_012494 [Molorchus minor]
MAIKLFALLFTYHLCGVCVGDEVVTTTTRSYDLEVPGSNPIHIVEGESPWKSTPRPSSRSWHSSFGSSRNPVNEDYEDAKGRFPYTALQDFLNSYSEKVKKDSNTISEENQEEKDKKSYNMMNVREHNHPYDDKKGWVTLEPVPWSVSKISKWHNKQKPSNHYPSLDRDSENDFDYPNNEKPLPWKRPVYQNSYQYNPRPELNENHHHSYYQNEEKPSFSKPSTHYGQKVHMQVSNYNRNPISNYHHHEKNCDHDNDVGIITDNRPSNFPSYPSDHYDGNRRVGTELHPESPFMGEGEWVLLSTTRGYKLPKSKQQRSLQIQPDSIGTRRSVRLTVLPPLEGSNVNMTTSHGGLLQVESTSETVEQAQRKSRNQKRKRPAKLTNKRKNARDITASTIATIPRSTAADSGALLAGVGAGLLPATMAMLVPLAMSGRRRRRSIPPDVTSRVEITLPRYL